MNHVKVTVEIPGNETYFLYVPHGNELPLDELSRLAVAHRSLRIGIKDLGKRYREQLKNGN